MHRLEKWMRGLARRLWDHAAAGAVLAGQSARDKARLGLLGGRHGAHRRHPVRPFKRVEHAAAQKAVPAPADHRPFR